MHQEWEGYNQGSHDDRINVTWYLTLFLQVYERASRMGLMACPTLWVWSMACMDDIFAMVDEMRPVVLVVDSIQVRVGKRSS